MNKNNIKFSVILAFMSAFLLGSCFIRTFNVQAIELKNTNIKETNIESCNLANGIKYSEKQVIMTENNVNFKERVNIIEADLTNKNLEMVMFKGQNSVKGAATLTSQINSLSASGKKVVGGINGDMYSTSTFIPIGPQVQDGRILVNYLDKSQEKMLPIFTVDKQNNVSIQTLEFKGSLTNDVNQQMEIDTVNRVPYNGKLQIFTRQYSVNGRVELSKLNNTAVGIVVKNVQTPIKLGENNKGIVEKIIKGNKDYILKNGEILIMAEGAEGAKLLKDYKEGSSITIYCDFNKPNIDDAIGGYTYLVKDGRTQTETDMVAAGASRSIVNSPKKARTALGITKDNKVICITVDGGQKSYNISDGISLPQFAKLIKNYNVVSAISFDGGGSTQMNIRRLTQNSASYVNRPSDGFERRVSNSVLLVDNSKRTNILGHLNIGNDITIYKNSKYTFNFKAQDTNYYPMSNKDVKLKWSCDSKIGTIDQNGNFAAKDTNAEGYVTAELNGVKDIAKVKVVSSIPKLTFKQQGNQYVAQGSKKQFSIEARDTNGRVVILNNGTANWKVIGNIGKIVPNGLSASLNAGNQIASGKVVATLGGKSAVINVKIGKNYSVVDDFESLDNTKYKVNGEVGGVGRISNEQHKSGKYSYRVTYDYKNWNRVNNGSININPTYTNKLHKNITSQFTSITNPKKLGMWVYGNGKAPWMRAVIRDKAGHVYTINFVNRITWTGWKFVTADIPDNITSAVTISRIYFVELNKKSNDKGTIYIDDIRFLY